MREWDYLHSPPGTAHVMIGAGDRPSPGTLRGADRLWPAMGCGAERHGDRDLGVDLLAGGRGRPRVGAPATAR